MELNFGSNFLMDFRAFAAEERIHRWKRILGVANDSARAKFESVSEQEVLRNTKTRVIQQDVLRTRADEALYKVAMVKALLRQVLIRFCSYYRIEYMQGLNEILAPVLSLDPKTVAEVVASHPSNSTDAADDGQLVANHPFSAHLLIFELLMAKLLPTTFTTRGVDAIQVQLTTFHLLLMYHEPVLATILRKEGMTPDIYAMSWLITLFARRQPVERALHIWDLLLQLDVPHVCVYLAVALLRSRKATILGRSADVLPETLVGLRFESEEEIDAVFADALHLMDTTPPNVTAELSVLGFSAEISESVREKGLKDLWHRPCIVISAEEVALSLAQQPCSAEAIPRPPARRLRYLVLDCRLSVEKQLLDALYIEGSVSIPQVVQEEIIHLAKHKSLLLDHDEMDPASNADSVDIERFFARLIGNLSTRGASVLSLLWTAFVTHCAEEVHLVVADDSTGPYQCGDSETSPLNTSYALPYHTACTSENLPLRDRAPSECAENLPQYLRNTTLLASNASTAAFASALILLGFPRVSIIKSEDLQRARVQSNENTQFSCTESNSFSSLPVMKTELLSSGFACLVHHLGACGVTPVVINAKYSHLQTPIDHHKEYQVCAFVHELRSATASDASINPDFYSGYQESRQSAPPASAPASVISPLRAANGSSISIVAAALSYGASPTTIKADASDSDKRSGTVSSSTLSTFASALSVLTPGSSPRKAGRAPVPVTPAASSASQREGEVRVPPAPLRQSGDRDGVALMRAKLACTLDTLHNLLLIMSAQKKRHIVRLVTTAIFHSSVPAMRAYSPHALEREEEEADSPRSVELLYLLGAAPAAGSPNAHYYEHLAGLFALRDTLRELVSAQRLNAVVDKTSNKASTKIRLLKSSIDQSARHASRALSSLHKKCTLHATLQKQREEAAEREGKGSSSTEDSAFWKTTRDLTAFFHDEDGQTDSRSTSVMRDSVSTDHWDPNHLIRGRLDSVDSVGLSMADVL